MVGLLSEMSVDHMSFYPLANDGSPFWSMHKTGKVQLVWMSTGDPDIAWTVKRESMCLWYPYQKFILAST